MKKVGMIVLFLFLLTIGTTAVLSLQAPQSVEIVAEQASKIKQDENHSDKEDKRKQEGTTLTKNTPVVTMESRKKLPIEQSIQETGYYCAPACVQMALRLFHKNISQEILANEMHTSPITGSEYSDMAITLNTYLFQKEKPPSQEAGYHIQTLSLNKNTKETYEQFANRVKRNIDDGYPLFAAVNLQKLYPQLPEVNHMVLISGYVIGEDSEEITQYYLVDPYGLVQDATYQGLKIFPASELFQAILTNDEPAYLW